MKIHLARETKPDGVVPLCSDKPIDKRSGDKWTTVREQATCEACIEEAGGKPKSQEPQQQQQQGKKD